MPISLVRLVVARAASPKVAECGDEDGESRGVLDHEIPAFLLFCIVCSGLSSINEKLNA